MDAEVRSTHFQSSPQVVTTPSGTRKRTGAKMSLSTKSWRAVWPGATLIPLRKEGRRVGEVTLSEYDPGSRRSTLNLPLASLMTRSAVAATEAGSESSGPMSRTVAPIKGFPSVSLTVPETRP